MGNDTGAIGALAKTVLQGVERPVILVDWADSALEPKQIILKAAVPVKGRAISIYEEVHPMRHYNSAKTHRRFLQRLRSVLPEGCRPIVVTDAGGSAVRGFAMWRTLGWEWVGRIRDLIKYFKPETKRWCYIDSLYRQATRPHRACATSAGDLCRVVTATGVGCIWCVRTTVDRADPASAEAIAPKYRQLHRTPWLLATSLPHHSGAGARIKRIYAQRMQIEETIRDLKSHRWGIRSALRSNETPRAPRSIAAHLRAGHADSVAVGTRRLRAKVGTTLPGQH